MTDLDAGQLRKLGIGSEVLDDDDLVNAVEHILQLGGLLEELPERDLAGYAGSLRLRPDALVDLTEFANSPVIAKPVEFRRQLRIALGFAADRPPYDLTPGEIEALQFFAEMGEVVGDDEVMALARVVGNSGARIARAATSLLRRTFETPIVEESGRITDVLDAYGELVADSMPRFLGANSAVIRRHFAALVENGDNWKTDRANSATFERRVVGFADLVGFTSFTEKADATQFVQMIDHFESQVNEIIVENGGTLVKLIGDAAMFVTNTHTEAIAIAGDLSAMGSESEQLSALRIGLASGDVISSGGDFYGTVVNIASRIVHSAYPDAIVATEPVARAVRAMVEVTPLGEHRVRGISTPVPLFRLRP